MSANTKIEWCDHTWSPWRGCTKVSPGCANCYAETLSRRNPAVLGQWGRGKPRVLAKNWGDPVRWNRDVELNLHASHDGLYDGPTVVRRVARPTVFPSLCDPFDDEVPAKWLSDFLTLTNLTSNLQWLLLTKRPHLWRQQIDSAALASTEFHQRWMVEWLRGNPPSNVSIGTSIEDQANADRRIPELLKIPAKLRFLSVEPMLGPVDLGMLTPQARNAMFGESVGHVASAKSIYRAILRGEAEGFVSEQRIDWVIVGGESGPGARPCNVEWVRSVVRQCAAAKVPCFVKQLGSKPEVEAPSGGWMQPYPVRHPKGGDPSEWPEDLRVRQFPEVAS